MGQDLEPVSNFFQKTLQLYSGTCEEQSEEIGESLETLKKVTVRHEIGQPLEVLNK